MQDYLCQGLAYLEYLILPIYGQINTATASSCVRIKELFIPEGYTTIYAGFQSLEGVEIIVIPTTVTSMWYNVFTNSYNLKVIIMQTATPPTITGASVFAGLHPSARIYVPVGSLAAYQAATNWSGLTIPILEMTEENKSKYSDEW